MIGHVMRDSLRGLLHAEWCETNTVAVRVYRLEGCRYTNSATRKALHALARRGYVRSRLLNGTSNWPGYYEWQVTAAGLAWWKENVAGRC